MSDGHDRWFSFGWRWRSREWCVVALLSLVACGGGDREREGGSKSTGVATPVTAATAIVENTAAEVPPRAPDIRLGDAVEVGPDGKPVPSKR